MDEPLNHLDAISAALGALGVHPVSRHQELAQCGLVVKALADAGYVIVPKGEKRYQCPVCATSDPNLYTICNRGNCPDGRDPR